MSPTARRFLLLPLQTALCVLTSLAAVWLLSHAIGFRFRPALVGAMSGSMAGLLFWMQLRAMQRRG